MERALASIQRIKEINVHPNADKLELATILGWNVVVKKGEFKVGDLVIYFEIDAVIPVSESFEFLRSSCYLERYNGFRIKTIRLRGELSSGLIMKVEQLFTILQEGDKTFISLK